MSTFNILTREEVNETNKGIFDNLKKQIGFVPNLYAMFAHSENALKNHLDFSGAPSSLKSKEKEVINLAVSQVNNCNYCVSAHTAIGKMNGFNDEQVLELRQGKASFDAKLDALAALAKNITENRGNASTAIVESFFKAGWSKENLVDTIALVGETTTTNYLNNTVKTTIDFPVAAAL